MSESRDDAPAGRLDAKRRRWPLGRWAWRYLVLPAFGLVASGLIFYHVDRTRSAEKMAALVAALDADEPGWRLEDFEEARPQPPYSRDGARLCRDLAKLLGPGWPDEDFKARFADPAPAELLDIERKQLLDAEMNRLASVLAAGAPMAEMPDGKHRIAWAYNPIDTKLPDQRDAREVAQLFRYESIRRANAGDIDGALRSARAVVCVGRSLSDEPLFISQLVRVSILIQACGAVEYALSLGEAGAAELAATETLLRDEQGHNGYLVAARGERGVWDRLLSRIVDGDLSIDPAKGAATWQDRADLYARMLVARDQPVMLGAMNRWVGIARLPPHEQAAAEKALSVELKGLHRSAPVAARLIPAADKIGQAWRRKTAKVAAIRGLIAVEYYRMRRGQWPATLADVVPEFLKEAPADPFDGAPIRMAKVTDGVIVYSVGVDGVDNSGKLDRNRPTAPGTDLGFQLWDVKKRRQPPSPPKPEAQP